MKLDAVKPMGQLVCSSRNKVEAENRLQKVIH